MSNILLGNQISIKFALSFETHINMNDFIIIEKYSWVDQRLREMYYNYALTALNVDEFAETGLLNENYAWVDEELEELCNPNLDIVLRPLPVTWSNRSGAKLECIDGPNVMNERKRSESDISDYEESVARVVKRLGCQSPIPMGKNVF